MARCSPRPRRTADVAQRITTSPVRKGRRLVADLRRLLYVTERGDDPLLAEHDVASGKRYC
jgi:hypothetical protein